MTLAPAPTGDEILAVASLWRAARREVITSFQGTSMLPTIRPGVEVVLDCARDWQIGDIIAFIDSGHLGVHRIVAASVDGQWLLTRGDHRIVPDRPFQAKNAVIGVITRIRTADDWIEPAPAPAPESYLSRRVLQRSLRAFHASIDTSNRQIRHLEIGAWFFRLGPRIVNKVARLLRLR